MSHKKINPRDYVVTPDTEISDIDLDKEEFILPDGRRLTEELAEQLAREAKDEIRRRNLVPGRKSLSGDGQHSPRVNVRLPEDVHRAASELAAAEHVTVSRLVRRAVEEYVQRHAS